MSSTTKPSAVKVANWKPSEIRELRKWLRMRQAEFGDTIGLEGTPESMASTISRWEHGKLKPSKMARIVMNATQNFARIVAAQRKS